MTGSRQVEVSTIAQNGVVKVVCRTCVDGLVREARLENEINAIFDEVD